MRRFNWSLAIGIGMGALVVGGALFHSSSTPWIFVNLVGFLIVGGGMCAAAFIMHTFSELKDLIKAVRECFYLSGIDNVHAVNEVLEVSKWMQQDSSQLRGRVDSITYYFLRDGVELLAAGIKPDEIRKRLEVISNNLLERSLRQSGSLLSFAKLGPGFGLLGTLLGLVVLLQEMGRSGNFDGVGPALAISLLATLYGVVFANLFFQPLAELIRNRAENNQRTDSLIIDGILMIKEKRHPLQILDALKNHLSWKEVMELDAMIKPAGNDPGAPSEKAAA